ncbi:DMT family transporter [Celerinatantimonas sp. YJH-8]|uniref:DMT family transporter n=1 Tax=Celerinatantimonas sp. YJH-8 TaxID=3228714 RepID=UPI0038C75C27
MPHLTTTSEAEISVYSRFTYPAVRIILGLVATLLWGSAFPMVKMGYQALAIDHSQTFRELLFAGYRFSCAGAFLLILSTIWQRQTWHFSRDKLIRIIKVGSFQTLLQYIFFYLGLALTTGISSAIVSSSSTFFQLIIAHFLFSDDRLNRRTIGSALIGFCGIAFYHVMAHGWRLHLGTGEALMLIAMFFGAYGNILSKRNISTHLPVLMLTAWQMFLGGICLITIGASQVGLAPFQWSVSATLIFIYLSAISAFAFLIWNTLMAHNQVGEISIFLFLIPIFGVTLSALVLHEPLHNYVLIALALVVIGIILANRSEKTKG